MSIPEIFVDLLLEPHFAHIATINPDNSPQVTPVWIDYEKENNLILVNTALGRKKARNLKKGSRTAISIQDIKNPYRYIGIQGEVIEVSEKKAREHINKLAKKYLDKEEYPFYQGEIRIIVKIRPIYVHSMG